MLQLRVAIIVSLVVGVMSTESFNPKRVHLIDYAASSNSYLFRANEPLYSNSSFDYVGLIDTMRLVVANSSFPPLPPSVFLVDVNLLSVELSAIKAEEAFFLANPTLGKFVHRPIWGSLEDPFSFPEPVRKEMAKTLPKWSHDDLPGLMQELRTMLTETFKNTAIFIHCNAGEDRTGEVSGSYYITYLQDSFARALEIDNTNENRDIRCASAHELIWYCLFLHYTNATGFPNLGSCQPQNSTYCTD